MTKLPNKKLISKQKKKLHRSAACHEAKQAAGKWSAETLNQCLKLTIIVEDA